MANYNTLISAIQTVVKQNGNNEITGDLLQQTLLTMVESLGFGYQFIGVATPETTPGTPDAKVFYIAGAGTYPNFGPTTIPAGYLGIFRYDSSWHNETFAFPIGAGAIGTNELADGAVTQQKIADGAVGSTKIADNAISSSKIANGAVAETKLASALINKLFSSGYKFVGVAEPTGTPGTFNQNVFYLAGPGTYTNYGAITVPQGVLGVLKYDGSWHLETLTGLGQMLEMGMVTQDGLFFIDQYLNVGAKLVQDGFFAINSITYREV